MRELNGISSGWVNDVLRPPTRFGWQVLNDLAKRVGLDLGVLTSGIAFKQLTDAVPFYAGLTLDEVGGKGVRWVEREQASAWPAPQAAPPTPATR